MGYLDPLIPAIPAFILGFSLVTYLTVRLERRLSAIAGMVMLLIAIGLGFYSIPWSTEALIAVPLCVGLMVAGYVAGAFYMMRGRTKKVSGITRPQDDPGKGHTAVVYVAHGEPDGYDPACLIERFGKMDEMDMDTVPLLSRPFYLSRVRRRCRKEGGPDNQVHRRILERMEQEIREKGDRETVFYLAHLEGDPGPDEVLVQAINEEASKIVVVLALLTESDHAQKAREIMDEVRFPIEVTFTTPLWDSNELRGGYVDRAEQELGGDDRGEVGVLLVGPGKPEEWDQEFPEEREQERLFKEDVLDRLERAGYERGNMAMAWMGDRSPGITEALRHLAERGVTRVLCFTMAIEADCLFSLRDLPDELSSADIPKGMRVVRIELWDDHPSVLRALLRKLNERLGKSVGSAKA